MFKKILILSFVLPCLCFTACGSNGGSSSSSKNNSSDSDSVYIARGNYNANATIELESSGSVEALMSQGKTFILFVYTAGCDTCNDFKIILNKYILDKQIDVYSLEFAKIKADSDLKSIASSTPFIGIYEEGKLKYNLISSSDADYECLSDAAKFYQWMDARIRYPNYYSIDLATLRKFINDDKKTFVVEHLWSVCPDCNFLASSFLNDYLKTAALDDKFYYIDCYVEGIKLSNGVSNDVQWTNYRNEFGLSASGSKFGFGLGHVPTIQYYKEGTLTNALTYMNDDDYSHSLSVQDFFTVSADGTYFKDSPYIGVTFVRDNGIMIDNNMYYVDKENNKLYKSIYDSGIKAYKNTFAEADFAYSINENKVTVDDKVYTVAYGTRDAKQVHRETTANFFNTKVKNFIERYL